MPSSASRSETPTDTLRRAVRDLWDVLNSSIIYYYDLLLYRILPSVAPRSETPTDTLRARCILYVRYYI